MVAILKHPVRCLKRMLMTCESKIGRDCVDLSIYGICDGVPRTKVASSLRSDYTSEDDSEETVLTASY